MLTLLFRMLWYITNEPMNELMGSLASAPALIAIIGRRALWRVACVAIERNGESIHRLAGKTRTVAAKVKS
ncbi:MAG: hypothetical protein IIA01_00440 [Proteobacteria bacterium]|nr:hypothetical protein [Pseudomonadota bacterium]